MWLEVATVNGKKIYSTYPLTHHRLVRLTQFIWTVNNSGEFGKFNSIIGHNLMMNVILGHCPTDRHRKCFVSLKTERSPDDRYARTVKKCVILHHQHKIWSVYKLQPRACMFWIGSISIFLWNSNVTFAKCCWNDEWGRIHVLRYSFDDAKWLRD